MSPLNPWKLSGYKAGQNVVCKVVKDEPGGYAVIIPKDNLPGFLPTQAILRAGEEILAQFVCVHNHRILLSARFSNNSPKVQAHTSVRWEEHLDEIDQSTEAGAYQELEQYPVEEHPIPPRPEEEMYKNYNSSSVQTVPATQMPPQAAASVPPTTQAPPAAAAYATPAQPLTTSPSDNSSGGRLISIPAQHSIPLEGQTEAEAAFGVWAATTPRKFHLKRATDLILPPIDRESLNEFKIQDYDLEWLITDLEGGMRTGCVKAACESKLSRSAMLLYRGRAVGCIYGCKSMPDTLPTEQSLQNMLSDLEVPDTDVKIYDLPENVTLAMSALFLGYPVQRNDDYDARAYMDYICGWFESKGNTACLAITLPSNAATCLGYVYKGQFCGAFYVEDQQFRTDKDFVYELLRNDPRANVEASILPPEMTSSAVRFGFSLSMAKKRQDSR
jgi:hypothetical protein